MAKPEQIATWLAGSAIAVVGISVVSYDVTQRIFAALLSSGHRVFPVRGGVKYIDGHRAFAHVQDIPEHVDGALVIAPPRGAERMVADCIEAGVSHIWIDVHAYARGGFALDLATRDGTDLFIADAAAELLPPAPPTLCHDRLARRSRRVQDVGATTVSRHRITLRFDAKSKTMIEADRSPTSMEQRCGDLAG